MKRKVVIFTGLSKLGKDMYGTAVVYDRLAFFLSKKCEVSLVVPEPVKKKYQLKNVSYYTWNEGNNKKLIKQSNVCIFGAYPPLDPLEHAYKQKKTIITYLWSIAPIGSLEFKDGNLSDQKNKHKYIVDSYNRSLELSNKIFVRTQRAKDLVLGSLISLGSANLEKYNLDRNFKDLIEVAPFGLEKVNYKKTKNIYRDILPGIGKDDFILIWNGGVWNWNNGVSLVKTISEITKKNKKVKLIFQGFHNPQSKHVFSAEAKATKKLSDKLKLTDKYVFFPENWIEYKDRFEYLYESNAGIVLSPDIPEANYFVKTRFYDYLAADLPIILNSYEAFAEEVKKYNLGLVLNSNNSKTNATEIIKFISNKKLQTQIKNNIKKYKQNLTWTKGLEPVVKHCLK